MLAYYRLGHSLMDKNLSNIVEFTEDDMIDLEKVRIICNRYCGYDIHITKSGWDFLIEHYGYEGLYEIDKSSKFGFYHRYLSEHSDNSLEAFIKWISDRIESYPKVPDSVYKADTPESIARSALQVGKTAEEVANLFEIPLANVRLWDKEVREIIAKSEEERKAKCIRVGLLAGKSAEKISEELDVSVDYILELDKRIKGQ
ncbi:MAG: hypothetical protein ACI4JY_10845 [Oscillospiraceae bacterium]